MITVDKYFYVISLILSFVNELKLGRGAAAWGQGALRGDLKLFDSTLSSYNLLGHF